MNEVKGRHAITCPYPAGFCNGNCAVCGRHNAWGCGHEPEIADDADADDADDAPHVGHYSRLGGTWWCDTCNSPYCDLA